MHTHQYYTYKPKKYRLRVRSHTANKTKSSNCPLKFLKVPNNLIYENVEQINNLILSNLSQDNNLLILPKAIKT